MPLNTYGPFTPTHAQLNGQWLNGNPIQYTPAALVTVDVEVTQASQTAPNGPLTFQYKTTVVGFNQHLPLPNGSLLGINGTHFFAVQPL